MRSCPWFFTWSVLRCLRDVWGWSNRADLSHQRWISFSFQWVRHLVFGWTCHFQTCCCRMRRWYRYWLRIRGPCMIFVGKRMQSFYTCGSSVQNGRVCVKKLEYNLFKPMKFIYHQVLISINIRRIFLVFRNFLWISGGWLAIWSDCTKKINKNDRVQRINVKFEVKKCKIILK